MGSRSRAVLLVVAALIPACVKQHHVVVTGAQLTAAAPAFQRDGQATVQVTDEVSGDRGTEVISIDQPIGAASEPHTPRSIIADPSGVSDFPFSVRRYETRSAAPVIKGGIAALVIGTFAVSMGCAIGCDDPDYRKPAQVTAISISAVGLAGLVVGIVLCIRDRDCPD